MPIQEPLTVSQLVQADYRLADVFKKWGINYCCGGNRTLDDVCQLQGLDKVNVDADMQQAQQTVLLSGAVSFEDWPVDFLVEYIVHVHHAYLKSTAPRLQQTFASFAEGHKKKYPHLPAVYEAFKKLAAATIEQTQQEEDVIFPYLKQVSNAIKRKESYGPLFARTLHKSPREETAKATQQTVLLLNALRDATDHYRFPANACTNYQVIYHKLKEFDNDLVQHKHLENNILFPKGAQMEAALLLL